MKKNLISILGFIILGNIGLAGNKSTDYSQTYVIFIEGERAGKETVHEKTDDNGDLVVQSENEIYLEGIEMNRMSYSTRMILNKKSRQLKSYVYKYDNEESGDSFEVQILGKEITRTLHKKGQTSVVTASLKPDMVFLDFNVYHQYDFLTQKYDQKKKGRQIFSDYIPVIGSGIPLALTFLDESKIPIKKGELKVRRYEIEFVGLQDGVLTVDKDSRLIRLVMPNQKLEVVREDLVPAD